MLDVVIATRNPRKVIELRRVLAVPGIRWHSLLDFPDARSPREDGRTFDANAVKKAVVAARATGLLALADDSGIEVNGLGGGPGVQSARFSGRHGDDRSNNEKLLKLLKGRPAEARRARYRCSLALADGTRALAVTRGTWAGRIAESPKGAGGFGYDPLFLVGGYGKTAGQLPAAVKRRLSHRTIAARRMRLVLRRLIAGSRRGNSRAGRSPARSA